MGDLVNFFEIRVECNAYHSSQKQEITAYQELSRERAPYIHSGENLLSSKTRRIHDLVDCDLDLCEDKSKNDSPKYFK